MTLEEKIATGHDPAVKAQFQSIRKALESARPDLLGDLEALVDQHERQTREIFGLKSTARHERERAYNKRFGR